jgi:hypothetical protein
MKGFPPEWRDQEPPFERLEYMHRRAFGGGLHVQIVRQRDGTYELTELPAPGIRAEAVNPARLLSEDSIKTLARSLAEIHIPIVPPFACGLDGWTSTLTIEAGFNKAVIQWWGEAFDEWAALDAAVQEICETTGCRPRQVSFEDRMREREEGRALIAAQRQARKEDFARRLEATRAKAISLGLATPENVNQVLHGMTRNEFGRHFSEFRVSRVHFKD